MLRRAYRLSWNSLAALLGFAGLAGGVLLLRSWTLVFLAVTAGCLAVAASAALADVGAVPPSRLRLTALFGGVLIGVVGLSVLVEWVAFALVAALGLARLPLTGTRGLTTAQLFDRWNAGLAALRSAATPEAAALVLRDRQRWLDELERRDPERFRRWLAAAESDPGVVLRSKHDFA